MSVDEVLFLAINGLAGQSAVADYFFLQLGNRSTLYFPGACAIAYWILFNHREAFLGGPVLGASVGLADFFGGQLKWVFERVRPCRALSEAVKIEPSGCGGLFSFPSNHAAKTAAIASFLQILYPKSGWITWPIVVLIGFARVYVGAHYVTDHAADMGYDVVRVERPVGPLPIPEDVVEAASIREHDRWAEFKRSQTTPVTPTPGGRSSVLVMRQRPIWLVARRPVATGNPRRHRGQ